MGLHETTSRIPTVESDTIVGVIDTGIWPESESFSDEGFGPPPKKWKGACQGGKNFTCNNKIIGARYYPSVTEDESARDSEGHGSHTASTAAGNNVKNVSFYGLKEGIARGGVPSARIAAYKVCSPTGCYSEAMLAAFDDAIADGVDIITISMSSPMLETLELDPISIGAFHAMKKGILTTNSAGNSGPFLQTLTSVAPWLMTVAASTTDQQIIDKIVLGNGTTIIGSAVNTFRLNGTNFPLVHGKDASRNCSNLMAGLCNNGCLDNNLVKGKIVLCDSIKGIGEAYKAGALGCIVYNDALNGASSVVPFPASTLTHGDYTSILSYISSTKDPRAMILKSEVTRDSSAPTVASFSSRGPNVIIPDILKVHAVLSPSSVMHNTRNPSGEFGYGSGHVNPVQAINPGLVYEALEDDYIKFLCNIGFDENKVRLISGDNSSCTNGSEKGSPKDLNYPSMIARVPVNKPFKIKFQRRVKNVGEANSIYKAKISSTSLIGIKVVPEILSFKSLNEVKSFSVIVEGGGLTNKSMVSASLVWSDNTHTVRNPIVLHNI
ncbi:hypothetical protein CsatB_029928 [Cannabis sativa]